MAPLAIITCVHYLYRHVSGHLFNLFTSSIHVESDDGLFDIVMAFLVRKSASTGLRSGIATTRPDKSTDLQSEDFPTFILDFTNFTGSGARKRVRVEPDEQHIWFLHNWRLFRFQRSKIRAPM